MTFAGGGQGGYPGPGPQQPQPGPGYGASSPTTNVNLPMLLSLGITLLGLVAYFCGFSDEAGNDEAILLLLVGGLLAAFKALPGGPRFLPVAAVLSVAGGLTMLANVISGSGETPGIQVVLVIMGLLQAAVAVVALLFDFGILKPPAPAQPQFGGYPQSGQFPAQQPPAGPYGQTQQYPQPPPGGQYQQQPGQHPGTPPGGYPQQG